MDTWISGYNAPLLDPSQDIYNTGGSKVDGVTTLKFSRKRITKDNRDLSFTDDHCLYMMYPVKGGIFNAVSKKIRKHDAVPIVSAERICIKSCGLEGSFFFMLYYKQNVYTILDIIFLESLFFYYFRILKIGIFFFLVLKGSKFGT